MRILALILSLLTANVFAQTKTVGIYVQYPVADPECAESLKTVLMNDFNIVMLNHKTLTPVNLKNIDILAFGGGLGDSDRFDDLLIDKKETVQTYVKTGGKYLGICMGAYFAGHYYFDILKEVDTVRYVKRPFADIEREDETIAKIRWNRGYYNMYFFDGCAIVGNMKRLKVFAQYRNNDAMAAIQDRVGMIGCHPESLKDWYTTKAMRPYWHNNEHHKLLVDFTKELAK
jgi:hypothetical protein